MQQVASEVHLVSFVVRNMVNLVCALAWASNEALETNIVLLDQAHQMLGAILERAKRQHVEEAAQ